MFGFFKRKITNWKRNKTISIFDYLSSKEKVNNLCALYAYRVLVDRNETNNETLYYREKIKCRRVLNFLAKYGYKIIK